jgi:sugar lactone lactonase YvrE
MTRLLLALMTLIVVAATAASAGATAFPDRLELPDDFEPEGIAIAGDQFYVGSIPTGAVFRGNLRTGEGDEDFVPPQSGRNSIGMKVDRGRLFVAGGPSGMAFVYDARTGENITSFQLSTGGSFINDVVVTKDAAWFTNSLQSVLYRVPLGPGGSPGTTVQEIPLGGDYAPGPGFNVNGIDATPNGKTLIIVQSGLGKLYSVTLAGIANEITLTSPEGDAESVPQGDGILLDGKTLYVVQNRMNQVAKIALSSDLASGVVLTRLTSADFDVPTTIAEHGNSLYAVNARFEPPPRLTPDFWVTKLGK